MNSLDNQIGDEGCIDLVYGLRTGRFPVLKELYLNSML